MHMADALLSPAVGATMWAGSIGALGYAAGKLKETIDNRTVPLMGVMGAFIFAAQMINFTIPGTGSSGHLGGGMILAILLGPHAAFLAVASVLTVQAFFFADGGLLALGCNIWNLGFYPCFLAYPLVYKPLAGNGGNSRRMLIAALVSVILALQFGAFSVVLETLFSGKSELPFNAFVLMMQPIHLAIGFVEGLVTAGVIGYIKNARPEFLEPSPGIDQAGPAPFSALKKIVITFIVLTVLTGGALSWFASTHPDGLEWSVGKITGKDELPGDGRGISPWLKDIQEKTAFLPDYGFRGTEKKDKTWPGINPETSVSGIVGSAIVLGFVLLIGVGIRTVKKRSARNAGLSGDPGNQ